MQPFRVGRRRAPQNGEALCVGRRSRVMRPIDVGVGGDMVPFSWSLAGEGIAAGWDSESPVSDRYIEPFRFTGTLDRVVVSVSGESFEDYDRRVEKAWLVQWRLWSRSRQGDPSRHFGWI